MRSENTAVKKINFSFEDLIVGQNINHSKGAYIQLSKTVRIFSVVQMVQKLSAPKAFSDCQWRVRYSQPILPTITDDLIEMPLRYNAEINN